MDIIYTIIFLVAYYYVINHCDKSLLYFFIPQVLFIVATFFSIGASIYGTGSPIALATCGAFTITFPLNFFHFRKWRSIRLEKWINYLFTNNLINESKKNELEQTDFIKARAYIVTNFAKTNLNFNVDPKKFFELVNRQTELRKTNTPDTYHYTKQERDIQQIYVKECPSCGATNHLLKNEKNFCAYCKSPIN